LTDEWLKAAHKVINAYKLICLLMQTKSIMTFLFQLLVYYYYYYYY